MALNYQWAWDVEAIGTMTLVISGAGSGSAQVSTGTWCHTDITSAVAGINDFAGEMQSELAVISAGFTCTFSVANGYTISHSTTPFTMTFAATGEGVRMRRALGFTGSKSGATSYTSDIRPYYLMIPAIQGRSQMTDEMEPDDIMSEAIADDGTSYQISRDQAEIWSEWVQQAETADLPATAFGDGTPVFKRHASTDAATDGVQWSYQHAWEHLRVSKHPVLVVDGTENAVHEVRADGASFRPTRMAQQDYGLWNVPFRTRLMGRL